MQQHALIIRIKALLAQEARLEIAVLETLAEIFEQRLWLPMGFASSHEFCVKHLGMSEDAVWRRRNCAELMRRYPALVRPLIAERRVTLTNLALVFPLIDGSNAERLIGEVVGKTKREVQAIVAREAPKPDVSSGVRTVRAPLVLTASELCVSNDDSAPVRSAAAGSSSQPKPLEHRSAERHVMRVMLSQATRDKLEQIRDIAPELSLEELVARALDALHGELERKRRAQLKNIRVTPRRSGERSLADFPETAGPQTHSRYVDAATRRHVLERDNYECQFVGENGRRCGCRRNLQFHHLEPFALGGPTTATNLTLYCKAHNLYQGELDFGPRKAA